MVQKKAKALLGIFQNKGFSIAICILFSKFLYYIFLFPVITVMKKMDLKKKQNRIIFQSSVGMADNAKALYEYMLEQKYHKKYEIIWLLNHANKSNKTKHVKFVKEKYQYAGRRTLRAYYYARTAKIIIFTHSFQWLGRYDEEQLFLNLWHGCGYKASKGGSSDIKFDYCLVPGDLFIDTKAKFFACEKEKIIPLGYPRYDWLWQKKLTKEDLAECFKINSKSFEKIIFWMPTFRKSESVWLNEDTLEGELGLPIIKNQRELNLLDEHCSKLNMILVIKQHHLQKNYTLNKGDLRSIKFLTDDDLAEHDIELYQLLPLTDGLISDYSSVAIDYLLLDRPMGFTLDDFENYRTSRGFVFEHPKEYMPGKHIYQYQDFEQFLNDVQNNRDNYQFERQKIRKKAHNKVDKGFCGNIVQYFNI